MKYFLTLFFLCSLNCFSQNNLSILKEDTSIEKLIVNKRMLDMMSNVKNQNGNATTENYKILLKKFNLLEVYTTKVLDFSPIIIDEGEEYIKDNNLVLFQTDEITIQNIGIYTNKDAQIELIKELIVLIKPSVNTTDTKLIRVTGEFSFEDFKNILNKLKLEDFKTK